LGRRRGGGLVFPSQLTQVSKAANDLHGKGPRDKKYPASPKGEGQSTPRKTFSLNV